MNKGIQLVFVVFFMSCFLFSCGSKAPVALVWEYEKDAVTLHITADRQLNMDKGKAYTLYLAVYQLSDPNKFYQLADDEDGLATLLETKEFDPSVSYVNSMIIYPGNDVTYKMDRYKDSKYIGIVAGYNILAKERIVRVYKVPVVDIKKGKNRKEPGNLDVDLILGPTQIIDK